MHSDYENMKHGAQSRGFDPGRGLIIISYGFYLPSQTFPGLPPANQSNTCNLQAGNVQGLFLGFSSMHFLLEFFLIIP
jgi:hypothetical protein